MKRESSPIITSERNIMNVFIIVAVIIALLILIILFALSPSQVIKTTSREINGVLFNQTVVDTSCEELKDDVWGGLYAAVIFLIISVVTVCTAPSWVITAPVAYIVWNTFFGFCVGSLSAMFSASRKEFAEYWNRRTTGDFCRTYAR